jgi:hypothetical protein
VAKGGFGNVAIASFSIRNDNAFDVKDVVIRCEFDGASGTKIGELRSTIYQVVKARSSKRMEDFNLGTVHSQVARGGCDVIGADL